MNRTFLFSLLIVLIIIPVHSAKYVGAKKCKLCHNSKRHGKVYEKLYTTKHSKSFDGLVEDGKADDPYCLVCHTTGFNEGGYKMGAPDSYNDKFKGVQCEECHGPGSDYMKSAIMKNRKKAIAKGLKVPDKKHCIKCHDKKKYPWAKDFNYSKRLKKIDHKYR
ncbi:MAG: multiheme c-type cytochrome [Acidobacteriota bacterium]